VTGLAARPTKLSEFGADLGGQGTRVADQITVGISVDRRIQIAERQRVTEETTLGETRRNVSSIGVEVRRELPKPKSCQHGDVPATYAVGVDAIELNVDRPSAKEAASDGPVGIRCQPCGRDRSARCRAGTYILAGRHGCACLRGSRTRI
jgi:hypothetical protein